MISARKILIVKLSSLGDIVHVTPCFRAIRRAFPNAHISMAVEKRFAGVVRYHPCLDEIIEVGHKKPMSHFLTGLRLFCDRDRFFDLAIDFQGKYHSASLVYLSRARIKAGRGLYRPFWKKVVEPNPNQHAIKVCAEIVQSLEIEVEDLHPSVYLGTPYVEALDHRLRHLGLADAPFLLINPFSRIESKMWPLENYAEIIRRVIKTTKLPIVVSGASYEIRYLQELQQHLSPLKVTSLVGLLSLDEALALYKRASLVLTGDSGPMHIAAALGTKVVALFGPTLPSRTGPWGKHCTVIQKKIPDLHHRYLDDKDRSFIKQIGVEDVWKVLRPLLI